MQLRDLRASRSGGESEISASIGDMRLWYRIPTEYADVLRVDAFVVAALMPAMARGEDLAVDRGLGVSPRLLQSIGRIQDILHVWNPELKKVNVHVECAVPRAPRAGAACFFSGGVDSMYTCLKHCDIASHLILLHGLDIAPEDEGAFSRALRQSTEIAGRLGKTLVPVQTNAREFCNGAGLTMFLFHGALLASVALLLGFARTHIAASHTYDDLEPWGSHAVLDPLWSTETCEIVYDGAEASRLEKVRAIVNHPELLGSLRVCARDGGGRNCGSCEKCLRTMTELRLVGVSSPVFPQLSPKQLRSVRISFDTLVYYIEACHAAELVGDKELESALRAALRRFEMRQLAKQADAVLLGGVVRNILAVIRPAPKARRLLHPNAQRDGKSSGTVRATGVLERRAS